MTVFVTVPGSQMKNCQMCPPLPDQDYFFLSSEK